MAEWLGIGLQNRAQQFDSAWYLDPSIASVTGGDAFFVPLRPDFLGGLFRLCRKIAIFVAL